MKTTLKFLAALAAIALPLLCITPAHAQQYGYKALGGFDWSGTSSAFTIPASGATNIAAITNANYANKVTLTKHDEFVLDLSWAPHTQPTATGPFVVAWSISADGTNWPKIAAGNTNSSRGFFIACAVDATNSANRATFTTNIPVRSVGYWRIDWITNTTDSVLTNVNIRTWLKPDRNG